MPAPDLRVEPPARTPAVSSGAAPGPPPAASGSTLPWLARLLDVITVVGALLALTVAISGGFREWTPLGRISVTSWMRPALWAVAVFLLRAWWWPRDRLFLRIGRGLRRFLNEDSVTVLPIYLTTRIGVLLIGFFAIALIGYPNPNALPWRLYENEFFNLPARFDAGWYLGIAAEGYRWDPGGVTGQQNIVFFPALPMLMRYGSLLLGRQLLWTGVAISAVAFLWALVYLYRIGREHIGADGALAAVTLLATYPFAIFFSAPYTEGLFLLSMVGAYYHFRRDELWQTAAWGVLCGLTRPNGCLLSIVLALMAVRPLWRGSWTPALPPPGGWARFADRIAAAATPGLGMIMYSVFIFFLTGNPLQWTKQQIGWGRVYQGLDQLLISRLELIDTHGLYGYATHWTVDFFYFAAVLFVLVSVIPVYRRFGLPLATLLLINVIPPLMMGGLLSMGRTTSVLFPTFLWLGAVVPASHRTAWIFGFGALQGLCAAMFYTWRPIF